MLIRDGGISVVKECRGEMRIRTGSGRGGRGGAGAEEMRVDGDAHG